MLSILASENLVRSQRALLVCSTAGPIRIFNAQTNEAELYSTHAFSMFTLLNIHYQTFTLWTCSRIRSIYSDFYASPFFANWKFSITRSLGNDLVYPVTGLAEALSVSFPLPYVSTRFTKLSCSADWTLNFLSCNSKRIDRFSALWVWALFSILPYVYLAQVC